MSKCISYEIHIIINVSKICNIYNKIKYWLIRMETFEEIDSHLNF